MKHRSVVLGGTGLLAVLLVAAPAAAQAPGPGAPLGAAREAIAARVNIDSVVAIASPRLPVRIEAALSAAEDAERVAANRRRKAERDRDYARASREVQVKEIDRVKEAVEMAEELDQKSRKSTLETERKLRERYRDLIAAQVDVHEAAMNAAEREARAVRALRSKLEAERRVAELLADWRRLHGEDAVRADAAERRAETEKQILDRLKKYFETERDEARERERLAEAERNLSDQRLKLLEHRRNLLDD